MTNFAAIRCLFDMKRHIFSLLVAMAALTAVPQCVLAQLTAEKRTQNLGTLQLYSEATTSFKIKNTSGKAVNVDRIVTSSSQMKASCSPMTIGAGGTANVSVSYNTDLVGRFTNGIYVYVEGSDKPLALQIKGKVYIDLRKAYENSGTKAPEVCPVCAHPKAYFEVHKENY